jgi:hypothetical protein
LKIFHRIKIHRVDCRESISLNSVNNSTTTETQIKILGFFKFVTSFFQKTHEVFKAA